MQEPSGPGGKTVAYIFVELLGFLCCWCNYVYIYVCTYHRPYRFRYCSESSGTSSGALTYRRRWRWSPRWSLATSRCLLFLQYSCRLARYAGARPELSSNIGFSPTLHTTVGFSRPTSTNSFVIIIHISSLFFIATVHPFIVTFLVSFVFNLS